MLVSTKDMLVKAHRRSTMRLPTSVYGMWKCSRGVMKACEKLQSPVILSFGSGFLVNTDINHL